MRHGETEWSLSGKHTSRTDLALTERGRERARARADELAQRSFALVLTSPLRRARETCELVGLSDRAQVEPELAEWEYGEYEGLTTPEIRQTRPGWWLWRDGCPGGEQPEQVCARADRVLARLRAVDGDVVVFAHGHILRVIAARWVGREVELGSRLALSAGTLSALGFERETEVILRWND